MRMWNSWNPCALPVGKQDSAATLENSRSSLDKHVPAAVGLSHSTPRERKYLLIWRRVHQCSQTFSFNSPKRETIQMFTKWWVHKGIVYICAIETIQPWKGMILLILATTWMNLKITLQGGKWGYILCSPLYRNHRKCKPYWLKASQWEGIREDGLQRAQEVFGGDRYVHCLNCSYSFINVKCIQFYIFNIYSLIACQLPLSNAVLKRNTIKL